MTRCPYPVILGLWLFACSFPNAISFQPAARPGVSLTADELKQREELAGNDLGKLMNLAGMVEAKQGRRLLHKVVGILADRPLPPPEMMPISSHFAKLLPRLATYPDEVQEIFASKSRKQIVRQVVYRRVLEQWLIDHPVGLTIVFEGAKGQELRLQTVQPVSFFDK